MTLVDVDKKGFYLGNLHTRKWKCTSTFARKIMEIRDFRSYALLTAFIIHVYYGCIWCISRGATPGNFWWWCAAQVSKFWPYFRPKNVVFHTHFQTWPLKSIPAFRTGVSRNYVIFTNIRTPTITSTSYITLSFLFIWNWNDEYIYALASSLENHTRFQTKISGQILYSFLDQNGLKTSTLCGGTYLYGL